MNVFDMAMQETTEDIRQRLANSGGLMQIPTENPVGHTGTPRGDGWRYFGPGIDGHPFRQREEGIAPNLKDPEKELELVHDAKSRFFNMLDPQDVLDYQRIMTDCANGKAAFGESEKIKDESCGGLKIWMRWYELVWQKRGRSTGGSIGTMPGGQ